MTLFEILFGTKSALIKKNCILLPLLHKGILNQFKIKNLSRGKLFGCSNSDDFTLIHTGMSPCLVGDAVLYLKETPCQNIILFGSCGGVKSKGGLSVGSLVTPFKCYSNESFTQMLLGKDAERNIFYANQELFNSFLKVNKNSGLKKVTCSTISSLKLEEEMVDSFIRENIDVVDMECSAFFSASSSAGFKAIALFYVSDIIKIKPFYMNLDPVLKEKLSSSIKKASSLLCEFIKKNLNV